GSFRPERTPGDFLFQQTESHCTAGVDGTHSFWPSGEPSLGSVSSIRQTGPPSYSCPWSLTNVGASLLMSQRWISAGCFPTSGAIFPFTSPISILSRYCCALYGTAPT